MASTTRRKKSGRNAAASVLPPEAWLASDVVWGEGQKVRLVTGPPSLIYDMAHVRSVHIVGFVNPTDVLLVQNRDETWTFPGGRLEDSETIAQALAREVWEEARATVAPEWTPVATTRIEFVNRVPGRVYRFHPSFLLWVAGKVADLSDEPCVDPADFVVCRRVCPIDEARALLGPLEQSVLDVVLAAAQGRTAAA